MLNEMLPLSLGPSGESLELPDRIIGAPLLTVPARKSVLRAEDDATIIQPTFTFDH